MAKRVFLALTLIAFVGLANRRGFSRSNTVKVAGMTLMLFLMLSTVVSDAKSKKLPDVCLHCGAKIDDDSTAHRMTLGRRTIGFFCSSNCTEAFSYQGFPMSNAVVGNV